MEPKEIQPINIETQDLMLQKLADIESLLTMRLQQAKNQGVDNKDDIELVQQLLAKIANATPQIKKVNSAAEFITNFLESIKGEPGEPGKNCDPIEVAAILKESEDFLNLVKGEKGDSVKGDQGEPGKPGEKGDDGKTPEKGKDYLTQSEIDSFKDDVVKTLENGLPTKVKIAVREFIGSDVFTQKVQKLINDKKTTIKDVQGLSEAIKAEIETVYDSVREYTSRSGGGNPQLSKMEDIDWNTIGDGLAIKWDATKKKFVFGTAGGASNHGALTGLSNDDHLQYALLAGRAGGQTIKGGSAVTDILTLVGTSGNGTSTSPAVQVKVGNNGGTTAITVLNNGNVGIGTTTATGKLHVNSGSASNNIITLNASGQTGRTYGLGIDSSSAFVIYDNVAATSRLAIADTGNIGIGTTTPTEKLSVVDGKIAVSGTGAGFKIGESVLQNGVNAYQLSTNAHFSTGGLFAVGTTPVSGKSINVLEAGSTNVGLYIKGAPSKTSDFIQVQDSSSVTVANITAVGGAYFAGNIGIGTTTPTGKLDINGDTIRLRIAKTPATSGSSGNQGEIAWDDNYIYVCTATNTWKRAGLSTW